MRNEILVYLMVGLSIFLILTIPAFIYNEPDLTEPDQVQVTSRSSSSRSQQSTTRTPNPGSGPEPTVSQVPSIFQGLVIVVAIIALVLILNQFGNFRGTRGTGVKKVKKEKEQVRQLRKARETALEILRTCIQSKEYTQGFINAYQELDTNLDYFREVARPKHFTPREYSFSVREPIFKPSVYRFVKIFYHLRYGNENANENDIHIFIQSLNQLFDDELNEAEKNEHWLSFEKEQSRYGSFNIPRQFDPTKPKGGKI